MLPHLEEVGPGMGPHGKQGGRGNLPLVKSNFSANTMSPTHSTLSSNFFPYRLSFVLATMKFITGLGMMGFAGYALYTEASFSRLGAGIWGGFIVMVSGAIGIECVRRAAAKFFLLSFFTASIFSLGASALVIIYATTGLSRDSALANGFLSVDGDLIPVKSSSLSTREQAMMMNTILIILGVLDGIFSLACLIICLREICQCYSWSQFGPLRDPHYTEGVARRDWLMKWLGQQKHIYMSPSSGIPYTKVSPVRILGGGGRTPPFLPLSSDHSSSIPTHSRHSTSPRDRHNVHGPNHRFSPNKKSVPPSTLHSAAGGRLSSSYAPPPHLAPYPHHQVPFPHPYQHQVSPQHFHHGQSPAGPPSYVQHPMQWPPPVAPLELYAPFYGQPMYGRPPMGSSQHSPASNLSHASIAAIHYPWNHPPGPSQHYGPWSMQEMDRQMYAHYFDQEYGRGGHPGGHHTRKKSKTKRKRRRSKSAGRKDQESHHKKTRREGVTDSDIDRTYTGLDRELAEEFIEQTMEPRSMMMQSDQAGSW